jgi:hypothetical protein
MWAIRILTGPQAGQVFQLKSGKTVIGRSPDCTIKLQSGAVSKEHASIFVTEDKIIITDLQSRNGTFVNGVKIQNQRLNPGDKIALQEVLLDIIKSPQALPQSQPAMPPWAGNAGARLQQQYSNHELNRGGFPPSGEPFQPLGIDLPGQQSHQGPSVSSQEQMSAASLSDLMNNFRIYIDNVAMPGIYHLAQRMNFRSALATLIAIYVVIVTSLTIIPIVETTKNNIRAESMRRAKTIARNMRDANKRFLLEKNEMAIDVRAAELEEGVTAALIIDAKDGTIIAPASQRGEYAKKPFVNRARLEDEEVAEFIDDSTIGVAIPITFYNAELGSHSAAAFSIVLYDTGPLVMNSNQTVSLFVQTFTISLIIGAILFFFLYKLVEHPIFILNARLDDALREGRDDIKTDYHFPLLEQLASNINSALSRIGRQDGQGHAQGHFVNRDLEAGNLVRMLPTPALALNAIDERIITTNQEFDRLVGGGLNLQGRPLTDIPDIALQQNLGELIHRMRTHSGEIAISEIPFPDARYEVLGQSVMGTSEPAYYLIALSRNRGDNL